MYARVLMYVCTYVRMYVCIQRTDDVLLHEFQGGESEHVVLVSLLHLTPDERHRTVLLRIEHTRIGRHALPTPHTYIHTYITFQYIHLYTVHTYIYN